MKKRLWLLCLLAAIILCSMIVDTYGLFETNSSGESSFSIGKWVILVNENNVSLTNQITLDDFAYTGNQHIESGYFAPGGSATLDITIDASETDVALEYVIDFDTTPLATHPNIVLSITNLDTNQAMTGNHYTGTMMLNDNREISLRLTLAWNNIASYDSSDSVLIDDPLSFTMSINFSQILSSSGSGNSI